MTLTNPAWLLLLVPVALAAARWPALRLHGPIRAAAIILVTLTLAGPRFGRGGSGRDIWLLVDRSDSAQAALAPVALEWPRIVERARGPDDRLLRLDFAGDAVRLDAGQGTDSASPARTGETRLASAVLQALADRTPGRDTRLLLVTDGHSTESLAPLGRALLAAGCPLDLRLLPADARPDARIASALGPDRAEPGSAVILEFTIASNRDGLVPWSLLRNGATAASGSAEIHNGTARIRLTDRGLPAGLAHYQLSISQEGDSQGANNTADHWLVVTGGPRVLLVSAWPDDPLATLLASRGWTVDLVTRPETLLPGRLTSARAVILHNVPASAIPRPFLASLDFHVRGQGAGLLMIGGRSSFGSGGYFESSIDTLLPVSLEQRLDRRRLLTAMGIVLDRSGSMAVTVPGGRQKIELAAAGAARAAELLGENDLLTVFAVDSTPHVAVPLLPVGANRPAIISGLRRIQSDGGGIYVYEGLAAAWKALQPVDVGQRHIVLFADAADAEEPGDYLRLLADVRAAGGTVSVIGLGTRADTDAALLEDIARLGGGRLFFVDDAAALPAVFAQETVAVARATFVNEPTTVLPQAGWLEIAARQLDWLPAVDGYNLCTLRPGATAAALAGDEDASPLIAAWSRGAGRVGAVTFPLAGPDSASARAWPGFAAFAQSLVRWLAGEDAPPGTTVRWRPEGSSVVVDFFHDESAGSGSPRAVAANGPSGETTDVIWERIGPGHHVAHLPLAPGDWLRGAVRFGSHTIPFGPASLPGDAEWARDASGPRELRALARLSGGGEITDLSSVWDTDFPAHARRDGSRTLLIAALACLLADALLSRLGIDPLRLLRRPAGPV